MHKFALAEYWTFFSAQKQILTNTASNSIQIYFGCDHRCFVKEVCATGRQIGLMYSELCCHQVQCNLYPSLWVNGVNQELSTLMRSRWIGWMFKMSHRPQTAFTLKETFKSIVHPLGHLLIFAFRAISNFWPYLINDINRAWQRPPTIICFIYLILLQQNSFTVRNKSINIPAK